MVGQVFGMEMNVGHERIFLGENVTSGVSFLVFLLGIFAWYFCLVFLQDMDPLLSAYQGKWDMVHPQQMHTKSKIDLITCAQRKLLSPLQGAVPGHIRRAEASGAIGSHCRM